MGLLNPAYTDISGEIRFEGRNLIGLKGDELRKIRGRDISMIFQDPFACLHPMYRVGDQIAEAVKAHAKVSNSQANARAVELLEPGRHPERAQPRAGLPAPVLGRHAPARDDRDGARPQPRRADRRRADDRARRDRAGADHRADRPREEGVRHRRDPDHARPRRHRRDRDARDGHVRRPRARVRPGARDLQRGAGSVHVGPARVDADASTGGSSGWSRSRARRRRCSRPPPGCAFHPRCKYRFEPCDKERPPLVPMPGGHLDACHLPAERKREIWSQRVGVELGVV